MRVFTISEITNIQETENIDNINIFYQYFIHDNNDRQIEIQKCLKYNANNSFINNIYLLNERIYSEEELSISSNKIIQIDIQKRLKFKDIFEYINLNNITGYNVIINADIFFDETIKNLFKSDIHINKKMYALLRYDCLDENNIGNSLLFGDRGDSQDTWIIHSNFSIGKKEEKVFNFEFGKPGCDNKITYLMSTLGFEILNDPEFIKTYHLHNSNIRNYSKNDKISPPYEIVMPKICFEKLTNTSQNSQNMSLLYNKKYSHKHSNEELYEYIIEKINKNETFIIPRVAGIENNYAIYSLLLKNEENKENFQNIFNYFEKKINAMKNNAGINMSSLTSIQKYSEMYLEAFSNCEMYAGWAPFDAVYQSINTSHNILDNIFNNKKFIYSEVFDIYHYIYSCPWTLALKNKRILIISSFEESIKSKISIRKEIYGIDLFPDCEIITIRPPQTQGSEDSEEFDIEFKKFTNKLDKIKNEYDIALVSCGGYGNLVCSYIYKSGKSAIYVGGVLQMYWGILGSRWLNNRPDIIRLFLNEHWTKPKDTEKPKNHVNIENSCYW